MCKLKVESIKNHLKGYSMKITHLLSLLLLSLFISCEVTNDVGKNIKSTSQLSELSERDHFVLNSSNLFGFDVFKKIVESEDNNTNVFISPLSISLALTMAENGTADNTLKEILSVLQQSDYSLEEINQSCKDLKSILENADNEVTMSIANSIWPRIGKEVEPEFINICKDYFSAHVQSMDWKIPESADTVNNWVEENTNGLIKGAVDKPVPVDVAMYLINTVYFKGFWTQVFDSTKTYSSNFNKYDNSKVSCDFMYKKSDNDTTLFYCEGDKYQAASLPYGEGNFYMTVLLPKENYKVSDLIVDMNKESWEELLGNMKYEDFELLMPKYKFNYKKSLKEILKSMGMVDAFSEIDANFSNMFVDNIGWISKVEHKTFIQTDESGTEAAAATIIEIIDSSEVPGNVVNLNRPYLFIIHEKVSKAILFMGRLSEPVWE